MKRSSRLTFVTSLVLLFACDGLGRPVVDRFRGGSAETESCPQRRPRCDDADGAPEDVEAGAEARVLPACELPDMDEAEAAISVVLRDCTLSLRAASGQRRELMASALDNVHIELAGPVHLRVADSDLFRVTLTSIAEQDEVQPASVQITHSDVRLSALHAPQLEIISSFLGLSRIETGELSAVDLHGRESVLFARVATISASRLDAVHVSDCDALLIAESGLTGSRIDACQGPTRLYDVEATACTLDGALESDLSSLVACRFGVRDASSLHGWNTSVANSALCRSFDSLRFSAGALRCMTCQGPLARPSPDVCLDNPSTNAEANYCEALDEPPVCETFPRRPRPFFGS